MIDQPTADNSGVCHIRSTLDEAGRRSRRLRAPTTPPDVAAQLRPTGPPGNPRTARTPATTAEVHTP